MLNLNEILSYFPRRIANEINKKMLQDKNQESINLLEEIRVRASKPVILKYTNLVLPVDTVKKIEEVYA